MSWIDFLVQIALVIIMLGIGLSLRVVDFKNLFRKPQAIFIGYVAQVIVLPILAFAIALISHLSAEIKVGIIIIALCPVGASSNLIVHLFRGNVALSISLTILNSITAPITIPLLTNLALLVFLGSSVDFYLPVSESIVHIFVNILIPAIIGMGIRHYYPKTALKLEKPLKYILPIILGVVFTIKIFFGGNDNTSNLTILEILEIVPYILLLNIIGMFIGFHLARKFKLKFPSRLTIAIEVGLQNTALALLIAGNFLKNYTIEKPILVYAMFTFFTAIGFAWIISQKNKRVVDKVEKNC